MTSGGKCFERLYLKTTDLAAVLRELEQEAVRHGLEPVDESIAHTRRSAWVLGVELVPDGAWLRLQPGVLWDSTGFLIRLSEALGCSAVLAAEQAGLFWALQVVDPQGTMEVYRSDQKDDRDALEGVAERLAGVSVCSDSVAWMALLEASDPGPGGSQLAIEGLLGWSAVEASSGLDSRVLAFARPRVANPRPPLSPLAPVKIP